MFKKLFNLFAIAFIAITITSCASNAILKEPATLTKYDNEMFWEINATDKNGEPSKIYVLGTIHAADDRLYPISENIVEAFINADALYGEISTEDNNKILQETMSRQMESNKRELARIEETGKKYSDYLTEDQKALAAALLGGPQGLAQMEMFEPWVLNTVLTTVPMAASGLDPMKSLDMVLAQQAASEGRTVLGLDTLETQFAIIEYGDWETQLFMLQEALDDILENQTDSGKDIKELYEVYLTGDEGKMEDVMSEQLSKDTSEIAEKYNYMVFTERNTDWANKFANMLNEGGTTFIFAGCGHFVGDDSVFAHMAEINCLDY